MKKESIEVEEFKTTKPYKVDHEQFPTEIKFDNGMVVRVKHVDARLYLEIENG